EIDAIINAGGNDMVNAITTGSLARSTNRRQYARELAADIIDNITGAIERISPLVDQIVVLGLPPLDEAPIAESSEQIVRGAKQFFRMVASKVNRTLERKYDCPFRDNPDVLIVDSFRVFDRVDALAGVSFVDNLHPAESTNLLAAGFIVEEVLSAMPDFGFPV
ncbi:MAG: SGNH/GDSL hydrolase family protein, partial [Synechococcaceae cyanobacterium]